MSFKQPTAEVKANFWKLNTPGDFALGVYVDRKVMPSTLKKDVKEQVVYTLLQEDGTPIYIGGRQGKPRAVISGLELAKFGEVVKVLYAEERKSATAGMHPTKIVKVFNDHETMNDVLDSYRKMHEPSGTATDEEDTLPEA